MKAILDCNVNISKINQAVSDKVTSGVVIPELLLSPFAHVRNQLEIYNGISKTKKLLLLPINSIATLEDEIVESVSHNEKALLDFLNIIREIHPNFVIRSDNEIVRDKLALLLGNSTEVSRRIVLPINDRQDRQHQYYMQVKPQIGQAAKALKSGKSVICPWNPGTPNEDFNFDARKAVPTFALRKGISQNLWVLTKDANQVKKVLNMYMNAWRKEKST